MKNMHFKGNKNAAPFLLLHHAATRWTARVKHQRIASRGNQSPHAMMLSPTVVQSLGLAQLAQGEDDVHTSGEVVASHTDAATASGRFRKVVSKMCEQREVTNKRKAASNRVQLKAAGDARVAGDVQRLS